MPVKCDTAVVLRCNSNGQGLGSIMYQTPSALGHNKTDQTDDLVN